MTERRADRRLPARRIWRSHLVFATACLALGLAGCGGGGSSGASAEGRLDLADCTIAADAATCTASIGWTTSNASSPRVIVGGTTVSTAASGRIDRSVGTARSTVELFDGSTPLDVRTVGGICESASAWDGTTCARFATRSSLRAPTPFVEGGVAVTLEVVVFRPLGAGPFPALVFHHGSTGNGDDPSLFRQTVVNESVARHFASRGWLVAFPQRRGRGASDGLYDEGFEADRSRYACTQVRALAGLERALDDARESAAFVASLPEVDASRLVVAGTSRGGILAIAQASREPARFRGAINFVGGWLGEGCVDAVAVNRGTFASSALFPGTTLWLYAENDPFYSVAHSRANHEAYAAAGGRGTFELFVRATGLNGHFLANDAALWGPSVDAYLATLPP